MTPLPASAPGRASSETRRSVAVFGAYGHTGRFVVAELHRRGLATILCGRDVAKLEALADANPGSEVRVASVDVPGSLDRAMSGTAVVINCAGPFGDTAPAVIGAALRAGVHYLDVTGESVVAAETFERYADPARAAGIVVAPAVGFFGGLGDLLATVAMAQWSAAEEVCVATALDSWQPTRGTRLAGQRRAGRRFVFADNRLHVRTGPSPVTTWDFPSPLGRQDVEADISNVDVVTIPHHLRIPTIRTFMNLAPIRDLRDPDTPAPAPADETGRSSQTFLVDVVARRGSEHRRVSARGRDIYAVTAPIVGEAAERILAGRFRSIGTAAVGEIFDATDFLATLSPEHLSVETGRWLSNDPRGSAY